jgi:putative ABC transport system permease protein
MLYEFRFALRGLRRNPGLIAAAILTMALGAGANTAIFSVIDSTLLRPLPYRDPARLAVLWESNPKIEGFLAQRVPVAGRNFSEWRNRLHSFEQIEALRRSTENLTGIGRPENLIVARVTPGFFRLLGRGAWLGRAFQDEDAAGDCGVVVAGAAFFARKFPGGARNFGPGSSLKLILNGAPYRIVGVMPADFHLPALWQGHEEILPDVWLPARPDLAPPVAGESRRNYVFARLRGGVSFERARIELAALTRQLEEEYPRLNSGFGSSLFPIAVEDVGPATRRTILSLQIAVIFVLLIACANVVHLLSARAVGRARDMAIRAALGASRARVARAALAESLLIGASGGALGVALARGGMASIDFLAPEAAYHLHELTLDWRVLAFSFAITFFATLLFSLAPALVASSANLRDALSQDGRAGGGRAMRRAQGALVAAETAFAVILVVGAGLMIRSMSNLLRVDPGFRAAHVLTQRVQLPQTRYPAEAQVREFCNRLLDSAAALPGVRAAAISTSLPMHDTLSLAPYRLADQPDPRPGERVMADFKGVSEDYFTAIGATLLRGRVFIRQDTMAESPQVAIINDALANQLSRFGDPLGRAILVGPGRKFIVGIVAGSRQTGLDAPERPEIFLPTRTIPSMTLLLRTSGDPMAAAKAAAAAVWALDPEQPVTKVRSLEDVMRSGMGQRRFDATLFAGFAGLALLLAALGLYGVLSHSVALRARELGVRMALGAQPAGIKWLVLRDALRLTLAGIVVGMAAALALTRLMSAMVFGVSTADPATFAVTAATLLTAATAASYIPAARAARLEPLAALRRE